MSEENTDFFGAKQDRSRRSAARLIEAAEALIEEHGFDRMSLRDVCRRAGVTSGSFYGRFTKKLDLALVLAEEIGDNCVEVAERFSERLPEIGIQSGIQALLEDSIQLYQQRGALFRALIATARTYPDVAQTMRCANDQVFSVLITAFKPLHASLAHPRPEKAVRLGLFLILNGLREMVLEQQLFEKPQSEQQVVLVDELTTLFLKYVGAPDA